jgi:hypothetical protein
MPGSIITSKPAPTVHVHSNCSTSTTIAKERPPPGQPGLHRPPRRPTQRGSKPLSGRYGPISRPRPRVLRSQHPCAAR